MIEVVPVSPAHVGTIANRMRAIDKLECTMFGRTPKQALRLSIMSAALAWTVKIDGRAEAMMGAACVSSIEGIGSPWLLMTDVAVRHPRALVELGRDYTDTMQHRFARLENRVHGDNFVAIRWLSRLGYTIGPVAMVLGQPMRDFWREARPLASDEPNSQVRR
jgi:hypothetical protein